jgi:hypothetical protein
MGFEFGTVIDPGPPDRATGWVKQPENRLTTATERTRGSDARMA